MAGAGIERRISDGFSPEKKRYKRSTPIAEQTPGERSCEKKFLGNGEVYRRLQQYEIPGVPMVYEAVSDGRQTVVLEEWINGISVGQIRRSRGFTGKTACAVWQKNCVPVFPHFMDYRLFTGILGRSMR